MYITQRYLVCSQGGHLQIRFTFDTQLLSQSSSTSNLFKFSQEFYFICTIFFNPFALSVKRLLLNQASANTFDQMASRNLRCSEYGRFAT